MRHVAYVFPAFISVNTRKWVVVSGFRLYTNAPSEKNVYGDKSNINISNCNSILQHCVAATIILRELFIVGFPIGDILCIRPFLLASALACQLFENDLMATHKRPKETNSNFIARI